MTMKGYGNDLLERPSIDKEDEAQPPYRSETFMSIYEPPLQTESVCNKIATSEKTDTDSQVSDTKSAVTALAEDAKRGFVLKDVWMPNNFRRIQKRAVEKDTKYWFSLVKDWLIFFKELWLMIFLMLILPTVDIGTDLKIAILWYST